MRQRVVYRLQHDEADTSARLVSRVVAVAAAWAAPAQPPADTLRLACAPCRARDIARAHRALRTAEGAAVLALVDAWLAATYAPRVLLALCSALHAAPEDVQESFFTVSTISQHPPSL